MSEFFTVAEDSRVRISRDFWLYWAVALPLTCVVLAIWLSWLRVDKIRARIDEEDELKGRGGSGYSKVNI